MRCTVAASGDLDEDAVGRDALARITSLSEAIAEHVHDGDLVAMEGFSHLIPFAAGHEIIRQRRRDLRLVRMTPDLVYDQMVGAGCAAELIFSWGGNPGVGSLHRIRDAIENAWPRPLVINERSHAAMAHAYAAGAAGLPFAMYRGDLANDLRRVNPDLRTVECPYTGETLATVPSIRPDVTIVHAHRADRAGNVFLEGITGVIKEAVLAAQRSIVTVEEIVDDLDAPSPNSVVLPSWTISAVVEVPGGARPSYVQGRYGRDNSFYQAWDGISKERERFLAWLDEHVLRSEDR